MIAELLLFRDRRRWHGSAAMSRLPCFLLCFAFWTANAHSAELDTRAVAFYYPWYGNPATDGRFANWNHAVAVRGEAPVRRRIAIPGVVEGHSTTFQLGRVCVGVPKREA